MAIVIGKLCFYLSFFIFITYIMHPMKKYMFTESQIKKVVDNVVDEQINENIKIEGHEFEIFRVHDGTVKAGKEGILGDHNILIPWNFIVKLFNRFND